MAVFSIDHLFNLPTSLFFNLLEWIDLSELIILAASTDKRCFDVSGYKSKFLLMDNKTANSCHDYLLKIRGYNKLPCSTLGLIGNWELFWLSRFNFGIEVYVFRSDTGEEALLHHSTLKLFKYAKSICLLQFPTVTSEMVDIIVGDESGVGLFDINFQENELRKLGLRLKKYSNYNHLDFSITQKIAQYCRPLQFVDLSLARITDENIACLANHCTDLREIRFSGKTISDRSIIALSNGCPNLQLFSLRYYFSIKYESILQLIKKCKNLRSLGFYAHDISPNNPNIFRLLNGIIQDGRSIRNLNLGKYGFRTDSMLRLLVDHCKSLVSINLGGCIELTDDSVEHLAQNCPSVKSINLSRCQITDRSATALGHYLTGLLEINVNYCLQLTDTSIVFLSNQCPNLQYLSLGRITSLTDLSLIAVVDNCIELIELVIRGCYGITKEGRQYLRRSNCVLCGEIKPDNADNVYF